MMVYVLQVWQVATDEEYPVRLFADVRLLETTLYQVRVRAIEAYRSREPSLKRCEVMTVREQFVNP